MMRERTSPNSSSFCLSGVGASGRAAATAARTAPMAVRPPVATTTARPRPEVTTVPEKSVLALSCATRAGAPGAHGNASTVLGTESDSPVSTDWSTRTPPPSTATRRTSAGTRAPTATATRSPGTSAAAGTVASAPPLHTAAPSASYARSSARARSALASVSTPTAALAARTAAMTPGSTNAAGPVSPLAHDSARSTRAAPTRILTSRSSNWRATRRQRGSAASGGSSFGPWRRREAAAAASVRPATGSVPKRLSTYGMSGEGGSGGRGGDRRACGDKCGTGAGTPRRASPRCRGGWDHGWGGGRAPERDRAARRRIAPLRTLSLLTSSAVSSCASSMAGGERGGGATASRGGGGVREKGGARALDAAAHHPEPILARSPMDARNRGGLRWSPRVEGGVAAAGSREGGKGGRARRRAKRAARSLNAPGITRCARSSAGRKG